MNKKKAFISAFVVLSQQGLNITALQFEDGSGYCYNYQSAPESVWHFIDMRSNDMTLMVFEALVNKKD